MAPLADNGGPTRTHLPLEGSPVIDAGNTTSSLGFDQRGEAFDRVFGSRIDIGAVELQPEVTILRGDVNGDGVVDFGDIPDFISVLQSGEFQEEADANGDGVVDFDDIPAFIEILLLQ